MIEWKIELRSTDVIPRWYGMAYRKWYQDTFIVMPIPINLLVQLLIKIYYKLMIGFKPSIVENIYNRGLTAGKHSALNEYMTKVLENVPDVIYAKVMEGSKKGIEDGLYNVNAMKAKISQLEEEIWNAKEINKEKEI